MQHRSVLCFETGALPWMCWPGERFICFAKPPRPVHYVRYCRQFFRLSTEQDAGRCVGPSCRVKTKGIFKEGLIICSPSKRYQAYGSSS